MTNEYTSEIVVGVVGVVTSTVAWVLGGKQNIKLSEQDTLTKGADQIVETSGKLLTTLEKMLTEERTHRGNCESELAELKRRIEELECKI